METIEITDRKRTLEVMGASINILASSEETGGQHAMIEFNVPPGFPGAPPHFHHKMVESFYILEGTVDLIIDGEVRPTGPGGFAIIQPGVVHGYRNTSSARARFLVTAKGHDEFFFELIEWMEREPVWPPKDRAALARFGLRHDTAYVQS